MGNRRYSRVEKWGGRALARVWRMRLGLLLTVPYLFLVGWLFTSLGEIDVRPVDVYSVPDDPEWRKPDREHWFGTTGTGLDLFLLTRMGMATSLAVAVVTCAMGIGLTHLLVMMFVYDSSEKRFRLLDLFGKLSPGLPPMLIVIVLAGGSGGRQEVAIAAMATMLGVYLAPVVSRWFREEEDSFEVSLAPALGLSRAEIVNQRVLPKVFRRYVGLFARLVPAVMVVEMALSFLGMAGDRITCGSIIAYGQGLIIEAPWMAVYPGILASAVVLVLTFLGWMVSGLMRTGTVTRWM